MLFEPDVFRREFACLLSGRLKAFRRLTHKNIIIMKENRSNFRSLESQEAIEKLQELVKHNSICFFASNLTELPLHASPMNIQQVDAMGNLWFISSKDSTRNLEIRNDSRIQLFVANASDSEYLSLYGMATISVDKKKIDEIWTPLARAWFTEGKDDPRITAIKVTPEEGFYWDTKSGRLISTFKMIASAITGKTADVGVRGELEVNPSL
jgi:general stress protein 26